MSPNDDLQQGRSLGAGAEDDFSPACHEIAKFMLRTYSVVSLQKFGLYSNPFCASALEKGVIGLFLLNVPLTKEPGNI